MERAEPIARPIGRVDALAAPGVWARAVPAAAYVAGIVVISSVVRLVLALDTRAVWIVPDELIYSELASSIAVSGSFEVRGAPFSAWSFGPLYPIVIAPAALLSSTLADAFLWVKVVNAVCWSSAAVPAYLLARRVVGSRPALVGAAFAVLVPSGIYTTKFMTESVAYPLFVWAALACLRALERPRWTLQLAVFLAVVASTAARAELLALVPAFALAAGALVVSDALAADRGARRRALGAGLRSFWPTWLLVAAGVVAASAAWVTDVAGAALGAHAAAASPERLGDVAASVVHHVAVLDLYVGVLPFLGLLLCATSGLMQDRSVRALVLFTGATTAALSVAAAVYLTGLDERYPSTGVRVYDRYVFYVAPLFFVGLLAWVGAGSARRRPRAYAAAALAGLLPLTLPYDRLLTDREWGTSSSSVALLPWGVVRALVGDVGVVAPLVVAFAFALSAVVVFGAAGQRWALPRMSIYIGVALGSCAYFANGQLADRAFRYGVAADPSWVDRAVGRDADVVAIWSGRNARGWKASYALWEHEAFNESIGPTYALAEPLPYGDPAARATVGAGGEVAVRGTRLVADFVLTDRTVGVDARRIATDARTGMVLYAVDGPVRLRGRP